MNKRERKDMPWIIAAFGLVVFGVSFPVSFSAGVRTEGEGKMTARVRRDLNWPAGTGTIFGDGNS
jgi:hypothetical protein